MSEGQAAASGDLVKRLRQAAWGAMTQDAHSTIREAADTIDTLERHVREAEAERDRFRDCYQAAVRRAEIELIPRAEAAEAALAEARQELERKTEALTKITQSFPATIGPAEDMLEDWMGAVARHKAIATAALSPPASTDTQERASEI